MSGVVYVFIVFFFVSVRRSLPPGFHSFLYMFMFDDEKKCIIIRL